MAAPALHLAWANPVRIHWGAGCFQSIAADQPVVVLADRAALAHALESLWNRNANPITEALALDAARLVLHNLPSVLEQPGNIALRAELSRASLLAGLAMSQTQTALAHALSYALTLKEGLPHGEACAVWLPMVWEMAVQQSPGCDAALARVFGGTAQHGAEALRLWLQTLGVAPRDLRQSASGHAQLDQEMRSARGRNFIANLNQ